MRLEGACDEVGVSRISRIGLGATLQIALIFEEPDEAPGLAFDESDALRVVAQRDGGRWHGLGRVQRELRV